MMKKILLATVVAAGMANGAFGADVADADLAVRNINRAMDLIDACWEKTMKGGDDNLYMADTYNTVSGTVGGPSDIWPLTAAVEAHCSLLEALEMVKEVDAVPYDRTWDYYSGRLAVLIDNLEYYRGTYRLPSYATSKQWSPYAVPRSNTRGGANVSGILNVYDDQMWLSRELIRAWRMTGKDEYLDLATYLADYVIDGWDCWRDSDGNEYGGITWGPGYNSKHACSNAPIIQPLVWLYDIYKDTGEETEYYFRDENNSVRHETRQRSELYLEFARKVYDWQKKHLYSSGVYWDMMGADGKILVSRGYRQHVDCGAPGGNYYSYNTGTMISGGAELFRVTGEERFKTDLSASSKRSLNVFARYVRDMGVYDFKTDATATEGFNTWFNDVLMRSFVDAEPYCDNTSAKNGLKGFQTTLDYAYENHNRGNMLPIRLIDGWGSDIKTKPFHQFAFASEYAMLAVRLLRNLQSGGIAGVEADDDAVADDAVYTLDGIRLGRLADVEPGLSGLYIVGGEKRLFGK